MGKSRDGTQRPARFNFGYLATTLLLLATCASAHGLAKLVDNNDVLMTGESQELAASKAGRQLKQQLVVAGVTTRPIAPEGGFFVMPAGIPVHLLTAAQHALIGYVEKFYHIQQQIAQTKLNILARYRHLELHWVRSVSGLQGRWFTAGLPGPFLRPAVPIPAIPAHLPQTALNLRTEYGNLRAHIRQQWFQIGIEWQNLFRHIVAAWEQYHLSARTHWIHLLGNVPFPPDAVKASKYHLDEKLYAEDARVPCPACGGEGAPLNAAAQQGDQ